MIFNCKYRVSLLYLPPKPEPPTGTRWAGMMSLTARVSVRVPVEAYRGGSGLNGSGKKAKTRPTGHPWAGTREPLSVKTQIVIGNRIKKFPVKYKGSSEIPFLPAGNLARLVADHYHKKYHCDIDTLVTHIRNNVWLSGLRKLVT